MNMDYEEVHLRTPMMVKAKDGKRVALLYGVKINKETNKQVYLGRWAGETPLNKWIEIEPSELELQLDLIPKKYEK